MRPGILVSLASAMAALLLGACGGNDFSGTYVGDVARVDQSSQQQATATETWVIADDSSNLHRIRGQETCDLALETSTCSEGCYNRVVLAGQGCSIDGQSLVLKSGSLESTATDIPDDSLRITMTWATAADASAAFIDTGLLAKQD